MEEPLTERPPVEPGSRLDDLARQVADGTLSRRQAATGIGATFAAILFAPVGVAFGRKDCPNGRVKCDGVCCPKGARCRKGKCRCPKGERKCGTKCVDTTTNRKNCGACRNVCGDGESCVDGVCRAPDQQAVCGDGAINGAEQCDGAALGGQTCVGLGFTGGSLACSSNCTFDTSACSGPAQAVCGNGAIEAGEQCDGTALGGQTCAGLGFTGGTLACGPNCTFNTSGCTQAVCGNGVREAGEQCDGADLGGETCISRGFIGGILACSASCTFITSGCTPAQCTQTSDCTPAAAGSCQKVVCSAGSCVSQADDTNVLDDGNSCTNNTCNGGVPLSTNVANNSPCSDGNLCTSNDVCNSGVCVGTPVVCTALDQCHDAGVCNPGTGSCGNPSKANGTPCNDGNLCTQADVCNGGVCTGGTPVVCTALDQCHNAGTCDPMTGSCGNPNKPDGTPCTGGTCQGGTCV